MGEVATGAVGAESSSRTGSSSLTSPRFCGELGVTASSLCGADASEMTRVGRPCSAVSGETGGDAGGTKDERLLRPSEDGRRRPRPAYVLKEGDAGRVEGRARC